MPKQTFRAVHANILEATAETNCPRGGDSGHGGRTVIELLDISSTDISVELIENELRGTTSGVRILLGGDAECSTVTQCLYWLASELDAQWRANWVSSGEPLPARPHPDKLNLATRYMEEAFDKAAKENGLRATEILASLLDIYVTTRALVDGLPDDAVLGEVAWRLREIRQSKATMEQGPALGNGPGRSVGSVKLEAFLKERDWSPRKFSRVIDCDHTTVHMWLKGTVPTLQSAAAIERETGIDIRDWAKPV